MRMDTIEGMAQLALLVDDESGTLDGHLLVPIHFFLIQHAVFFAHARFSIGQQCYRQAMLVAEGCMANAIIPADADHNGVELGEMLFMVAELVRLHGASGRVILGIEIQHNIVFSQMVGKAEHLHVGIGQFELRCVHSSVQLHGYPLLRPILNIFCCGNNFFSLSTEAILLSIIPAMNTPLHMLGGLTVKEFLHDYWQKKPLLIRQAFPRFKGLLSPQDLINLACNGETQARIVTQHRGKFGLQHAPFAPDDFRHFGSKKWTVLVQGVNHYLPAAADLLSQFNFIPHARLDDLMVSYAPKGGGVGPHFDAYDVFLLQGHGHRRWQISTQDDRELIPDAPLRILQRFHVEQEWVLEPGDMLYLPPQCGHNGIAEDDCMTYSIGFRTPWYQELAEQFLVYLQDRIQIDGTYADPHLKTQKHPSEVGADMLDQVSDAINKVRWDREDIANFLGCYLSEPKPHIFFDAPQRPLSHERFAQAVQSRGVSLDLKTQMLCHGNTVFLNGEAYPVGKGSYRILRELADFRRLPAATRLPNEALDLLHEAYLDGYLTPGQHPPRRK